MFVFHTLLAGNAEQFGAPGTVVPATTEAGAETVWAGASRSDAAEAARADAE